VWVDGGFVRGTDIVKGIALGAEVVGLGRIACMGLAAAGEAGLVRVLELLEEEVRICLGLLGVTRLDELDTNCLSVEAPVYPPSGGPSAVSAFPLLDLDLDRY
jgi:glycolate oxidase